MKEDIIFEIKDRPSIKTHATFLQNLINRMASNSSNTKALTALVYTIIITLLISIDKVQELWWIGIICSIIGIYIDAYYLALERIFRKQYNKFLDDINSGNIDSKKIFEIVPRNTQYKHEINCEIMESFTSFSIISYYVLFIIASILIKFI